MMLQLEFIRRRPIPWLGLFCMGCALAWGAILMAESLALRELALQDAQRAMQLEQTLKERRLAALTLQAKSEPETLRRQKEQEKIIAALRYPWTRMLSTIEQADSNEVAVLSLSHEQTGGQTQIALEALDSQALVHFVNALNEERSANFPGEGRDGQSRWYITNYQSQRQDGSQTVKGTILNK